MCFSNEKFSMKRKNCMNRRKFSLFSFFLSPFAPYFYWCSTKSADYGFFSLLLNNSNQACTSPQQTLTQKNKILFWRMLFFCICSTKHILGIVRISLHSFHWKFLFIGKFIGWLCWWELYFQFNTFSFTVSSNSNVRKAVVHAIFNKGRVLFWLDVEIRMLLFRSNHFVWYILQDRKCFGKLYHTNITTTNQHSHTL